MSKNKKLSTKNYQLKTCKGFTLVELLVVIAIIGILAAIVMVSLSSTRDRARVASLQSTLASITTIANLCVNDGADVQAPTSTTTGGATICDDASVSTETWPDLTAIQGLNSTGIYGTTTSTTIIGGIDPDANGITAGDSIITCTVNTGSCARGVAP